LCSGWYNPVNLSDLAFRPLFDEREASIAMMIARITPADFAEVARLLETHNANPSTQCLHSGEHAGEIVAVFQKQKSLHFVVARENGALVGAMGCEVDEGRG